MNWLNQRALGFVTLIGLLLAGCSGDTYPTEVTLQDAPRLINEAFKDEKDARVKTLASQTSELIKVSNFTAAHGSLSKLLSFPSIASEKRDLLAGVMITVSENLNKAAEQGDPQANQYLRGQSFGK